MRSESRIKSGGRGLVIGWAAALVWGAASAALLMPSAMAAPPADLTGLIEKTAPSSEDAREPIPAAVAQREATAKIRAIFADEYAGAKSSDEKRKLARALIDEAGRTKDPVDRWSLFGEGIRTAAAAGDVDLTLQATDAVAAEFRVEPGVARLDSLLALAEKVSPQAADTVAQRLLEVVATNAVNDGKQRAAAVAGALTMAKKSKNRQLITLAMQAQAQLRREEAAAKELDRITAKLRESPDDPEACLEAGMIHCFTRGDWEAGLPFLARCSDESLAALARAEGRSGDDPSRVVELAEGWLSWAAEQKAERKAAASSRARELLASVVDRLEGLDRTRVQKKLATLEDATPGVSGRPKDGPRNVPGLVLWLEAGDLSSFKKPSQGVRDPGGERVDAWKDLSGNGNHAVQPDAAKQPKRRDNAVVFDGDQFLTMPQPLPGTAVTVLAVYRASKATADSTLVSTRTASTSGWMIDHQAGSVWFRGFADGSIGQVAVAPATPEGIRVVLARMDPSGQSGLQVVGVPPARSDKNLPLQKSPTAMAVGGKTGDAGGSHFRGELLRLLVFSRALSDDEVAALLAWNAKGTPQ